MPKCAFAPTFRRRASSRPLGGYQSVDEYLCPGGRLYEQREADLENAQLHPRLERCQPKAAFYIFPKVDTKKFNIHSDEQMALDLLKEQKILITAGTGFNWGRAGSFPHRLPARPRFAEGGLRAS